MDLSSLLNKATLVIGTISTTIIDSLYNSFNYVVYAPVINNHSLIFLPITPPIDSADARIPIARTEKQLYEILINKEKINLEVYEKFVKTSMDNSFIKNLI